MLGPNVNHTKDLLLLVDGLYLFEAKMDYSSSLSTSAYPHLILSIDSMSTLQEKWPDLYQHCSYLSLRPNYMGTYLQTLKLERYLVSEGKLDSNPAMITFYYEKNAKFKNRFRYKFSNKSNSAIDENCIVDDFPSTPETRPIFTQRYFAISSNLYGREYFLLSDENENVAHNRATLKLFLNQQSMTGEINKTITQQWRICLFGVDSSDMPRIIFIPSNENCNSIMANNQKFSPLQYLLDDDSETNVTGFVNGQDFFLFGLPKPDNVLIFSNQNLTVKDEHVESSLQIVPLEQFIFCEEKQFFNIYMNSIPTMAPIVSNINANSHMNHLDPSLIGYLPILIQLIAIITIVIIVISIFVLIK